MVANFEYETRINLSNGILRPERTIQTSPGHSPWGWKIGLQKPSAQEKNQRANLNPDGIIQMFCTRGISIVRIKRSTVAVEFPLIWCDNAPWRSNFHRFGATTHRGDEPFHRGGRISTVEVNYRTVEVEFPPFHCDKALSR